VLDLVQAGGELELHARLDAIEGQTRTRAGRGQCQSGDATKTLGREFGRSIIGAHEHRLRQLTGCKASSSVIGIERREQQPSVLPDGQKQGAELGITDHQPN
jgi:hypothetical protein